ncbi:MgtC/SapB family protein [Thomasclavelia sp.]
MKGYLLLQGVYLLRIIIASICGIVIGYERQNRLKVAGVRTHLIVCLASAVIMIVSKYGFNDILNHSGIALDPSRIAAQIISGVSFLGAGIIFVHKREITGLTTAAGIWATAAVGMAIGAGMYLIGILVTVFILLVQIIFHKQYRWIPAVTGELIYLEIKNDYEVVKKIRTTIQAHNIDIMNFKMTRNDDIIVLELLVKIPVGLSMEEMLTLFDENNDIITIEIK